MNKLPPNLDYIEIDNFLTIEECNKYIEYINELFTKEPDNEALEIDGYQRLRISNNDLSDFIKTRLSNYYNTSNIYLGDKWFPTKYINDGGLCIHCDGSAYDEIRPSTYTVLLYLNDSFDGGRTVFVDDYDDEEIVKDNSIVIKPTSGKILILSQTILHFAEKIENGEKYIFRGDIFYSE